MQQRDRRQIRYEQFAKPRRPRLRLLAYIGLPLLVVGAAAGAAYVKWTGGQPEPLNTAPPPALAKASGPTQNETYRWSRVAIGGGGFISGIAMDPAGKTFVARADVYGAYVWSAKDNLWHQLATTAAMPAADRVQDGIAQGAYEIAVAPSRPDRIYMAIAGKVYRSDDRGARFEAPVNAPQLTWDPANEWRLHGPFMAVDPKDPDLVLLGTPSQGVWRSTDAGRTWQQVPSVPTTRGKQPGADVQGAGIQGPGSQIWFESSKGKPTGRIFAFVWGRGMFVSADRGATFAPLAAAGDRPMTLKRGGFGRDGTFYGVDAETKTVWLYRGGAWQNVTQAAGLTPLAFAAVAVDPHSDRVLVTDEAGNGYLSQDGGKKWSTISRAARVGEGDPPWLKTADNAWFTTGDLMFDPAKPDRVWIAHGVGVFYADLVGGDTHLAWVSQARGMEELVTNDIVQTPGHAPVFAAWDFGMHIKHDLTAYSTRFAPDRYFMAVQQVDWTPADPAFLVTNASDSRTNCCSEDGNSVMAGYSTDGGNTWTKFATLPTPPGTKSDDPWRMSFGTIAVSSGDTSNIVWAPAFNRAPFFTKDRGKTWEQVILPGATGDAYGSFRDSWLQRKTLTADKTRPGVFYLVHSGDAPNETLAGLWRSEDGGASWQHVHVGEIAPSLNAAAKLRSVPGKAGHLFFTSGLAGGADLALRRSTDGGVTWSRLEGVTRVDDVAFGKAAAGASYPAIYISGQVGGRYGIWRSVDETRSWQQLVDFPVGTLDQVTVIAADPDVFGRVYMGYKGSGWIWGEPAPCSPAPYRSFMTAQCTGVAR